jgi:hypothetical protein
MPTLVIYRSDYMQILGTSVNRAVPLSIQAAAAPVQETISLLLPADMLNTIREAFGLNITQLAQALGIERITVYAWLKTESLAKLHDSNRSRLNALHRVAKLWQSFEPLAGSYLLEKLSTTQMTVLEMLCQEMIDLSAFSRAYEQLAKATGSTMRALHHRAEQKAVGRKIVKSLRHNMDKLGLDLT